MKPGSEEHKLYMRQWRLDHPDKKYPRTHRNYRKDMLAYYYKMTLQDYNDIFIKQNGLCAICKRHQSEFKRSFAVDEVPQSRGTEKPIVRGLLCFGCNISLGHLQDNIQWLENAIDYLKRSR